MGVSKGVRYYSVAEGLWVHSLNLKNIRGHYGKRSLCLRRKLSLLQRDRDMIKKSFLWMLLWCGMPERN